MIQARYMWKNRSLKISKNTHQIIVGEWEPIIYIILLHSGQFKDSLSLMFSSRRRIYIK
jgi:hypothetical protein